jgi:RNA-directed DNA polymerase
MRRLPLTIDELAAALDVRIKELYWLANNVDKQVLTRQRPKKDGTPRFYLSPSKRLKAVQSGIRHVYFDDYTFPSYVYGLGGTTLADHARVHQGVRQMVQVDIRKFFPTISHKQVHEAWLHEFGVNPDLGRLLTKLTTHGGELPQGFPTSSHMATVIARPFTEKIQEMCQMRDIRFTQYVDDLNFSARDIDLHDLFKTVVGLVQAEGFAIKRRKTVVTGSRAGKVVTGVSLTSERLRATRSVRKRAIDALHTFETDPNVHNARRVGGYLRFIRHLNRADGKKLQSKIEKIRKSKKHIRE